MLSTHSSIKLTTPHLSHPCILCNNIPMDMTFLVQVRQSNKCGSVRNDEIISLHLGSGLAPWVSIPCLLQDTSQIYWFHPPKQLTRKKQRTQKWDWNNSNKDIRNQKTKVQVKETVIIPTPVPPPTPTDWWVWLKWINHHPPTRPHIIHNNNTMGTEFLVQMRQSN